MDNHNNTTDDVKDSFLELEKSLANNAAKKRKKQFLQKVLITIGIAIIVILIIILIIVLRPSKKPDEGKKEEEKEIFNGVIKAKYMINDLSKKIKIINTPMDKLKISVFNNGKKLMDLKEDETEIFFNNITDNTIELKYQGKITNLFSLFSNIINLEEIDLRKVDTNEVSTMEKLFYGCSSLKKVNMYLLNTPNPKYFDFLLLQRCALLDLAILSNLLNISRLIHLI